MQWASERVQRTGSGRVSQDVSARGMAMSEVKDGDSRVRCKTSSGVDCSFLRAHACDGRCWSSRARAAQSSQCLQETRRASDAAAKPFRQLPRRYNFILLLCTLLLIQPICLLIRRIYLFVSTLHFHLFPNHLRSQRTTPGLLGSIRLAIKSHAHASFF